MENPVKMDDLGVPLFLETPIVRGFIGIPYFEGLKFSIVHGFGIPKGSN